jgi:hypothetical protein
MRTPVRGRTHSIRWQSWTIGFGSRRPFVDFSEQGMTLRGLRCANTKVATTKCHLFMSMGSVASREPSSDPAPKPDEPINDKPRKGDRDQGHDDRVVQVVFNRLRVISTEI